MRGHRISLIAAACLLVYLVTFVAVNAEMSGIVWKEVSSGIRDSGLHRVAVSPGSRDTAYVSSLTSVYKTNDGGKNWDEVWSLRGTGNIINALAATGKEIVFAGTGEGLYRSGDSGIHWIRTFRGVGGQEDSVFTIAADTQKPDVIFIGTGSGIYRSENAGKDWKRGRGMPAGTIVTSISIADSGANILYASTGKGVFKSVDGGINWQRILGAATTGENDNVPVEDKETDADEIKMTGAEITSVSVDPSDSRKIYLGTSTGLLISEDSGTTWRAAGESGLLSRDIRQLAMSSGYGDSIFAATQKGVFQYHSDSDVWNEIYEGLVSADIRSLVFSPDLRNGRATLWAATGKGIYKTVPKLQPLSQATEFEEVLSRFSHEPTIDEIRTAATDYAEVSPGKIEKWRKAAANKAWLPDLSFSYNKNKSWQKSTYFYSTKDEKYTDDDFTHDRDNDWSVTVKWELGDLIWNNDQTSIDSRSKLMVELRDDVLNEVTRLYFERRRVQIEMLLSPPLDIAEKLNKELRLQELTAVIDALTGSCLSRRLAEAGGLTRHRNEL